MGLIGCAVEQPTKVLRITPEMKPYLDLFIVEAKVRGVNLHIDNLIMAPTDSLNDSDTLAICYYEFTPRVLIGTDFWAWAAPLTREQVIFHELGHCLLRRSHNDDSILYEGSYIPESIMSRYLFPEYYYETYRDYYLDELFHGR